MNYLKRRFSSGDLQSDSDENVMTMPTSNDASARVETSARQQTWQNKGPSSSYTSAPSSPTRSFSLANQFITVARGVVNQAIQQIPHQPSGIGSTSSATSATQHHSHHHSHHHHQQQGAALPSQQHQRDPHQQISKEKSKILLVIDDQHTDW